MPWRLFAEAVSIATNIGIHVTSASEISTLSASSQIHWRLFAHLFVFDKVFSIFTGRPPLLSGRYCSTPLPLDLKDENLADLSSLDYLDVDGWNVQNEIFTTTVLRARAMMAYIKDEILEISLSTNQEINVEHLT